jgi:hypothetical protein
MMPNKKTTRQSRAMKEKARTTTQASHAPGLVRQQEIGSPPALSVKTDDAGRIFSHIRQKWLVETPEERVRQSYVVTLHNEYGFGRYEIKQEN